MLYDLIYPDDESKMEEVSCLVASSYFDTKELIGFGVNPKAFEVSYPFADDNEFEKVFKLWDSPLYLSQFFRENIIFFQQEYWNGITEEDFVSDVTKSLNEIRAALLDLFQSGKLYMVVEPLSPDDGNLRPHQSIKIKIKQGWIHRRLAFRFYAIEIEEQKCYLITGGAIKVHKDMLKAPNTTIEMNKLEFALNELAKNDIDTKELFIDFIL